MKTSKAVCDELGDESYMEAYVLEAGNTHLCSIETKVGCSTKEIEFMTTYSAKTLTEVTNELNRLLSIISKSSKLKSDAKNWIRQRIGVLKQFQSKMSNSEL